MSNQEQGQPRPNAQIVEQVLAGTEQIVSHEGASQYEGGGIASCGLAGLNFVRVVLARVEEGLEDGRLLEDVLSRRTSEEVISICSRWSSNVHLEVEDIFKVPLFERALTLVSSTYGEPGFERFRALLSDLQSIPNDYAAVLITRPPEIITCLRLPIKIDEKAVKQDVFIIFDSHPRTDHPTGAGLIVNTSLDATASHLNNLLAVDTRLLADSSLQWQTQLLANFSGHFFVSKGGASNSVEDLTQAVLESSLVALGLQAEVVDLRFQNSSLARDREFLEIELDELKEKYRSAKKKLDNAPRLYSQVADQRSPASSKRSAKSSNNHQSIIGPSKFPGSISSSSPTDGLEYFSSPANIKRSQPSHESADYLVATQLQMDHDWERRNGASKANSASKKGRVSPSDDYMVAAQLQMDWDQAQRDSVLKAQAKQREFEEEDSRLLAERAALQMTVQRVFDCGVCFDKYPEDYVARVAGCAHPFCRECLKSYVVIKLGDKLFPIVCPMCVTDTARAEPAMITDDLVQTLGLNDKEYQVLQELQIASMSILLHCRKCKESIFVDRTEYEASPTLVCPLPACDHVWCKACQQTIDVAGPQHSCDGSSELEHLMKRRGWKHCPGCKTPFQKSSGCNHMTCMSPGCNTHFCYVCGAAIVRSALPQEVKAAVSAHYRRCSLFEDVPDR
ncbi:hypothetical protein B0H10DRAFT_2438513 [Mycena sp. CBHHK59/15]|nr:hypothetical protein B0H10DRAFT_2438513 [Mycena sp. CBHHK59/15]